MSPNKEKKKKGAVADGTLVVQFASATGELRKRFNDGVTIRSKMSCAGQRKAWTVVMPKPADGSSSAERSISVKQEMKKRVKAMLMPHPKQEKSRGNNARVEFKTGERESFRPG